jgi:hypothetical protein
MSTISFQPLKLLAYTYLLNGNEKVDRYFIKELLPWETCKAKVNAKLIYGRGMISVCYSTFCDSVQPIGISAITAKKFGCTKACHPISEQLFNATEDTEMFLKPPLMTGQWPIGTN